MSDRSVGGDRHDRVAGRVREELMAVLLRGGLRDPGVEGAYIAGVRVTNDLRIARVYVRLLDSSDTKRREQVVAALKRAAGRLRRLIGPSLKLRYMPELRFFWDDTTDRAQRMEELLEEIRQEHGASQHETEKPLEQTRDADDES